MPQFRNDITATMGTGIQSEPIPDSDMLAGYGLDLYPTSTREVLSAAASIMLDENPATYVYRTAALEGEATYDPRNPNYNNPIARQRRERLRAQGEMLSKDDANKEYGIPGYLTFDTPEIPRESAHMLNAWKHEQLTRENVLRRGQGGILETVGKYVVSFAVSALDPINLAAAFVPVVGEARYAAMVARVGRPTAGLLKGMAEGATGQTLLTPLSIGSARMMQDDYTMMDALLDIGFGTALGGGLHMAGGWLKARAEGMPAPPMTAPVRIAEAAGQEAREVALRGAVAAVLEDRPVRVGDLLAAAQPDFAARAASIERQITGLRANNLGRRFDRTIASLQEQQIPYVQAQQIQTTLGKLEENNLGGRFTKQIDELRREGDEHTRKMVEARARVEPGQARTVEPEPESLDARMVNAMARRADLDLLRAQQDDLEKLERVPIAGPEDAANRHVMRERLLAEIGETKVRLADPMAVIAQPPPMSISDALDYLQRGRESARIQDVTAREATHQLENPVRFDNDERVAVEQVTALTQRSMATPTDRQDLADAKAIEEDIQRVQALAKTGDVEMLAEIKQADELVKQADGWARGLETAAVCLSKAAA